jgi:hypothetical protein
VVKSVIQFNGIKMLAIIFQPLLFRKFFGIEEALPMIVGPAGSTDF